MLPQLLNGQALLIAVGIIGATIMPHALYLHSGLTQARIPPRTEAELARMLRASNREVAVALGLAGLVNMAMVLMAAAAFHAGRSDIGEIATAYESLTPLLAAAAGTFQFERDVGECLRPLGADGAADIIDEHEVAIASCVR